MGKKNLIIIIGMIVLVGIILISSIKAQEFSEYPSLPYKSDYMWVDSGEEFSTLAIDNEQMGIITGMYLPKSIGVDKDYPIYLYFTRTTKLTSQKLSLSPIEFKFCIGPSFTFPPSNLYLHFGLGIKIWPFIDTDWDYWMKHIPIYSGSNYQGFDTITYIEKPIEYKTFSDIPYKKWDGPHIIHVKVNKELINIKSQNNIIIKPVLPSASNSEITGNVINLQQNQIKKSQNPFIKLYKQIIKLF